MGSNRLKEPGQLLLLSVVGAMFFLLGSFAADRFPDVHPLIANAVVGLAAGGAAFGTLRTVGKVRKNRSRP